MIAFGCALIGSLYYAGKYLHLKFKNRRNEACEVVSCFPHQPTTDRPAQNRLAVTPNACTFKTFLPSGFALRLLQQSVSTLKNTQDHGNMPLATTRGPDGSQTRKRPHPDQSSELEGGEHQKRLAEELPQQEQEQGKAREQPVSQEEQPRRAAEGEQEAANETASLTMQPSEAPSSAPQQQQALQQQALQQPQPPAPSATSAAVASSQPALSTPLFSPYGFAALALASPAVCGLPSQLPPALSSPLPAPLPINE